MNAKQRQEVLKSIQEAVVNQTYVMTPHALLEMRDDDLDVIERGISDTHGYNRTGV